MMTTRPLIRANRLRRALGARRSALNIVNVAAASCFVIGCVGFYWPTWYVPSVTMFLVGSVLFLAAALATALADRGPPA